MNEKMKGWGFILTVMVVFLEVTVAISASKILKPRRPYKKNPTKGFTIQKNMFKLDSIL